MLIAKVKPFDVRVIPVNVGVRPVSSALPVTLAVVSECALLVASTVTVDEAPFVSPVTVTALPLWCAVAPPVAESAYAVPAS